MNKKLKKVLALTIAMSVSFSNFVGAAEINNIATKEYEIFKR